MSDKEESEINFWRKRAKELEEDRDWYKKELANTQEILGRVIVQHSKRWDEVKLTNYPRRYLND